jgi:hypothetical protein
VVVAVHHRADDRDAIVAVQRLRQSVPNLDWNAGSALPAPRSAEVRLGPARSLERLARWLSSVRLRAAPRGCVRGGSRLETVGEHPDRVDERPEVGDPGEGVVGAVDLEHVVGQSAREGAVP